jgi:hypothetical protein
VIEKLYNTVAQWILKHLSPLYLSMFVLICAVFLFVPGAYLKYFGLDGWAVHYRPYFAAVFLVSFTLLSGQTIQYFYRDWHHKRRIRTYLQNELSQDEVMILLRYTESGRKTQYFDPASGAVNNLARNGILHTPAPLYNKLKGVAFTLTRAAAPLVLDRKRFQKMILAENKVNKRPGNSN